VQWLPSLQWQQRGLRANPELPRSVWESTTSCSRAVIQRRAWFRDRLATHITTTATNSASLLGQWPSSFGPTFRKEFPLFRRWAAAIPGADRVWTPTLYFGLVVVLLAFGGCRLWGRTKLAVGLNLADPFFGLGSLGWYGLGWMRENLPVFQVAGSR
jgi:hypothetical protein